MQTVTTYERVLLSDMDFNLHMNNAMYNNVLDFSRFQWLLRLSSPALRTFSKFKVANGGVAMYFLREINYFKQFAVRTQLLGMDEKWFFLGHRFESPSGDKVCLRALPF